MATYRIALYHLASADSPNAGALDVSSLEVSRFSCSWVLNAPGVFEADGVLGQTQSLVGKVGTRQIIVFRDNVAIWGGFLKRFDVDADSRRVRISGDGWWSIMRSRVNRSVENWSGNFSGPANTTITAAGSLAWTLVSKSQQATKGGLGWSAGIHTGSTTSMLRKVDPDKYDNVGRMVEEYCDLGYGDFEITPVATPTTTSFAKFNTWKERGTNRTATIQFSGSNTMTLNYSTSAETLYSVVDTIGNDFCTPNSAKVTKTAALNAYGLREAPLIRVDSNTDAELKQAGTEFLAARSIPIVKADVTYLEDNGPALSAYDIGDLVRVFPSDTWHVGTSYDLRVVERELAVEERTAVVGVTLEQRTTGT